ncbi:hypothetical protein MKW94_009609 [Papaver nudicaule]|uniref:Transcription initiation factor IIE subunit beta n=1 Tax=Papaver nudicaule TaxID=74823 RepID=A0AA41UXX5_PAPNU|nr:hypothetical protein [Papaver nudicaule]
MALQKSLTKFNQQQEKCLSTLSNVRPGSSRAAPPTATATSSSIAAKFPTTKFSSNIESLQQIYNIQHAEPAAQVKRVIDLLKEIRQSFTAEQIKNACHVDAMANKNVFNSLTKKNPRVNYDGERFWYKPKHNIKDKEELRQLILKNPEGIAIDDLSDAYKAVKEDLLALKVSGDVWWLSDSRQDVVYPNDPRINIKVDDDLKLLFRNEELPRDMIDIEKYLRKNGMVPMTNTAKRREMAQGHGFIPKPKDKKKPRKISKRTKLTNAHLPELFRDPQ